MISQIALTIGVFVALTYTFLQRTTNRALRYILYFILLMGAYFIWNPDHSTLVARAVGIGRGADLITYFWIIFSLIAVVILHLKIRLMHEQLTELSRAVATSHVLAAGNSSHKHDKG